MLLRSRATTELPAASPSGRVFHPSVWSTSTRPALAASDAAGAAPASPPAEAGEPGAAAAPAPINARGGARGAASDPERGRDVFARGIGEG